MEENEDRRTLELFPRARNSYEVALGRFMKRRIRSTSSTERILTRQPEEEVWLTVGKIRPIPFVRDVLTLSPTLVTRQPYSWSRQARFCRASPDDGCFAAANGRTSSDQWDSV